jgi:hypothetical protein
MGQQALNLVGNETAAFSVLSAIAAEIIVEAARLVGMLGIRGPSGRRVPASLEESGCRALIVPSDKRAASTHAALVLNPRSPIASIYSATNGLPLDRSSFQTIANEMEVADDLGIIRDVWSLIRSMGDQGVGQALWITQPELTMSPRPKMVPLCAPWPNLEIACGNRMSTAGVFCRDDENNLGITACFHGTGPVGTPVTVGLQRSHVKSANNVQDIVFVPLGAGYNMPPVRGAAGVLRDRTPGQYDVAHFHGASSGEVRTRITSYDAGLLRARETIQLRVQTPPDTNFGDSGAALINENDKVLGFAFERTGFGEFPEMTDWIWAANALKALGLTVV